MSKGRYFCGGSALAVTLAMAMGGQASAQNNNDVTTVDEVISTGTFIQGAAEDAALAVEAFSREDLLNQGSPSAAGFVRGLSEVGLTAGQSNRGKGGTGDGVETINLRGFGAGRTLVLMNGIRLADEPTTSGGEINSTGGAVQNINSIPMEVLSSVQVLKDGGGAAYGSDAVAGAVNFVTRRDLNGFEASANYTWIADTDGDYNMNIQWGRRNDTGNLLVSMFYSHSSPLAARDRDWAKRSFAFNGATAGTNAPYQQGFGTYVFTRPNPLGNLDTVPGANVAGLAGYNAYIAQSLTFPAASGPGQLNAALAPLTASSFLPFVTSGASFGPGTTGSTNISVANGNTTIPGFVGTTAYVQNSIGTAAANFRGINDPAFGPNGQLRPDGCVELGGYAGFNGTTPTCYYALADVENIKDERDTYRVLADLNYDLTDMLRYHGNLLFSKTNTFVEGRSLEANIACDPLPFDAQSYYPTRTATGVGTLQRLCFTPGYNNTATASTAQTGLSVPGYNPAVRDYVLRFSDSSGQRVFTDEEINTLTGMPQGTSTASFNGGDRNQFATVQLGQGYVPTSPPRPVCAAGITVANRTNINSCYVASDPADAAAEAARRLRTGNYGKVNLTGYQPLLALYNTAWGEQGEAYYRNQSTAFTLTQDVSGDLGEKFGNVLDFKVSATYQRNINNSEGPGLLTDRLQRALNGFGIDLNDPGDGCNITETAGTRLIRVSPAYGVGTNYTPATYMTVSGVPYTVGAGGGADYDGNPNNGTQQADFGFNPNIPGSASNYAGNGCFFFNPFPSAIRQSRINGATVTATATQVGFVGANTTAYGEGRSGNYQGYAPGYGLENSPGVLAWLFQPMSNTQAVDQIQLDFQLRGTLANYELPGGAIDWAFFTNYRYNNRTADLNSLSDRLKNPCPYLATTSDTSTPGNGPGSIGFAPSGSAADGNDPKLNLSNNTSTCTVASASGAATGPGVASYITGFNNNPYGQGGRETVNHGIGAELNLPVLANNDAGWGGLNVHFIGRYDESKQPGTSRFIGGSVYNGDIKWQATKNFTITGNITSSFDAPTLDRPPELATWCRDIPTSFIITTIPCTLMNPNARRTQVYNQDLGPEGGLNWGFGTIFQTDDSRTQVRLQYFNDRVTGRAQSFASAALGRVLTGVITPNTASPPDAELNCDDPQVQLLFDASRAPRSFNGRPFVEYENASGNKVNRCVRAGDQVYNSATDSNSTLVKGVTLRGINTNNNYFTNNGVQDELYTDPEDYGIVLLFPHRVNAGDIATSGLDLSASHTFADLIFGGQLSLNADATWALTNNQDATFFEDVQLQLAFDYIGTQSSTPGTGPGGGASNNVAARANILQGSISANYRRGNHNFFLQGRWNSPTADNSTLGGVIANVPGTGTSNLNPVNPAICDTLNNNAGLPFTPQPVNVEQIKAALNSEFGVGEQAYRDSCNLPNTTGNTLKGQFVMDMTYRTQLPWDTALTVTVNNLLDTPPPFQVYEFNYNPAGNLSPDGRTIQVGLQKKF